MSVISVEIEEMEDEQLSGSTPPPKIRKKRIPVSGVGKNTAY
jgi:hypothetical protein